MRAFPWTRRVLGLVVGITAVCTQPAAADPQELVHKVYRRPVESGLIGNSAAFSATAFFREVRVPGAPWIRLIFDRVDLEPGSMLVIRSLADGEEQVLDAAGLAQWQNTSAYFNGEAVTIEVMAAPGTAWNRLSMSAVLAGAEQTQSPVDRRVCTGADTRVLSGDARVARLLAVRLPLPNCTGPGDLNLPCGTVGGGTCTGNMTDVALAGEPNNRVLLTAGHCFDSGGQPVSVVAQFEPVPLTDAATCGLRHPPVAKQFIIDTTRVISSNQGPGNDWGVFACFPNSSTGRTVFQEAALTPGFTDGFALAPAAPAAGLAIHKYGYGTDGEADTIDPRCQCVRGGARAQFSATQQTATGTISAVVGHAICHNVHDCPGDSGECLLDDMDRLVGLGTAGSCSPNNISLPCAVDAPDPRNAGTSIRQPALQAAIASVRATGPVNDRCDAAITVFDGQVGFSTIGAATDGPPDTRCNINTSAQIDRDIWFRYVATTTGTTRFSTRGSSFDTRIAIYPAGCPVGADTALACDDDDGAGMCSAIPALRTSVASLATVTGRTYLIRIGGFGNASGAGVLNIAPVPANDLCADAFGLAAGASGTVGFNTAGACTDGPAPAAGCPGQLDNDVWFDYESQRGGSVLIRTCAGTTFDTQMAVYGPFAGAPPCGALPAPAACNNDTAGCGDGRQSAIRFDTTAGRHYLVRIGGRAGASGPGVLTIGPENDRCQDAANISASVTPAATLLFRTIGAETDGPGGCGANQDVWMRYDHPGAAANQLLEVNTCEMGGATFDTVLAAYTGAGCAPLGAQLACNDNSSDPACTTGSRIVFAVTAGDSYLIRLGGVGVAAGNANITFRLRPLTPANDDCANAALIGTGAHAFSTFGATTDGPAGCAVSNDVWYRYDHPAAAAPANLEANTCEGGANFDTALALYSGGGCAPVGALAACGLDDCGPWSRATVRVTGGDSVLIRVGGSGGQTGIGTLRLRLRPDNLGPTNDQCADAQVALDGSNPFNTGGATTDGPVGPPANCNAEGDIWFTYVATRTGAMLAETCTGTTFNTVLAVYSGPCAALGAPLACNDDTAGCGDGTQSRIVFTATAGTTYRFRIGGSMAGFEGAGVLTIRPLVNDACAEFRTVGDGTTDFSTLGATTDGNANCLMFNDLWFRYTATTSSPTLFSLCGSAFDTALAIYDSTACPPVNILACNDDNTAPAIFGGCGAGSTRSSAIVPTIMGRTYTIRAGGFGSGAARLIIRPCFNDNFVAGAPGVIQVRNGANPFDNTCATTDGVNPTTCGGAISIDNDLWFIYFASNTGDTTFATCGSGFDTALGLYTTAAVEIACGDDVGCGAGGALNESLTIPTIAGTGYLVRIGSTAGGAAGAGTLTITPPPVEGPANNDCANALTVTLGATPFDTTGATTDGRGDALCAFNGMNDIADDAWFAFTPDAGGTHFIDTCTARTFDTRIAVYTACPPADPAAMHTPIACNDDACGLGSELSFTAAAGMRYLIRVGAFPAIGFTTGTGVLTIRRAASADACANYTMAFDGPQVFSTLGATTDGPAPVACEGLNRDFDRDIWMRYIAAGDRRVRFSLCGSGFDTQLAVYRSIACPPAAADLRRCNDDSPACGGAGLASLAVARTFTGQAYTLRIGGFNNQTGVGVLTITPFCIADYNFSGLVGVQDLFDFLQGYFGDSLDADIDGDGAVTVGDVFAFLEAYFMGC